MKEQHIAARYVDDLGRVALLQELRKSFNINAGDSLDVFYGEDYIILKKSRPSGIFCRQSNYLSPFMNLHVYVGCQKKLSEEMPEK